MSRHIAALATLALTALTAAAGGTTPPAGPVSSTMKTLAEVEPRTPINATNTPGDADSVYRIGAGGSYYFTGDVIGEALKYGIEIGADNVAIDLMGFSLSGVVGSFDGISTDGVPRTNIVLGNGTVGGWSGHGIDLGFCTGLRVRDVNLIGCAGSGLRAGQVSVITGCNAVGNAGTGIFGGSGAAITDCSASQNLTGITASFGSNIRGCSASDNSTGFSLGQDARISDCAAYDNDTIGISVSRECHALNNTSTGNGTGIRETFGQNRIEGNHCAANGIGFDITNDYNFIARNTASLNTTNWNVLQANNVILVIAAQKTVVGFSGDSGGVAPGSTDPTANYSISLP